MRTAVTSTETVDVSAPDTPDKTKIVRFRSAPTGSTYRLSAKTKHSVRAFQTPTTLGDAIENARSET